MSGIENVMRVTQYLRHVLLIVLLLQLSDQSRLLLGLSGELLLGVGRELMERLSV